MTAEGELSAASSHVMPLGWMVGGQTSQLTTQTTSSTGTAVEVQSVLTQANHAPVTPACIGAVASSGAHARECMCRAIDTSHIHGHECGFLSRISHPSSTQTSSGISCLHPYIHHPAGKCFACPCPRAVDGTDSDIQSNGIRPAEIGRPTWAAAREGKKRWAGLADAH